MIKRNLLICGDLQDELVNKVPENSDILVVGNVEFNNPDLEKKDLRIWCIQGNFDECNRITLLKDHEPITIQDKLIYPVGEELTEKPLPPHIDIMLSYDAPTYFSPPLIRPEDMDWKVYEQIRNRRKYLSNLLQESTIDKWFYGRYHTTMSGTYGGCMWRCLGPLELFQC